MSPRKKPTAYGHGHIRPTAYGTYAADLSRGGERLRRRFRTRAEAEAWIDAQSSVEGPPLTAAQLRDAAEAFALLPLGASLAAFVRASSERALGRRRDLGPLVEVYLDECAGRVRARTLGRYRRELRGALESPLLGADLSRHTKAALRAYLNTVASPNTRRHIRSALSALYGWLIDRDLMDANPAALVKLPKTVLGAPVILSLEETQRLLDAAAVFRGARSSPMSPSASLPGCARQRPCVCGRRTWGASISD